MLTGAVVDERRLLGVVEDLIRRPSCNPPGGEEAVAIYLAQSMTDLGATVDVVGAERGRPSVIATIPGIDTGRTLIVNGHTDVVPVVADAWAHDPFEPTYANGRLSGRGACDMKGGIGAALEALHMLRDAGERPSANLAFHWVADEETGGLAGTRHLLEQGLIAGDACLIPEPTGMRLGVAERGALLARITVHGQGGHGSVPELAISAIADAARIVHALHLRDFGIEHELLGRPTCNVGTISGGSAANIVADECSLSIDRRVLPGATATDTLDEVMGVLGDLAIAGTVDAELVTFVEPSEISSSSSTVAWMQSTLRAVGLPDVLVGSSLASDARFYRNQLSIPTMVIGPGEVAQAHTSNEWVGVDQLRAAAQVYYQAYRTF